MKRIIYVCRELVLKRFMYCLLSVTAMHTAVALESDAVAVSFDNLYPMTPYRKALNQCMQVYGQLNSCTQGKSHSVTLPQELVESSIQLHLDVDAFVQQARHVQYDDIEYIMALIERMVSRYELIMLEQPTGKIIYGALREAYVLLNGMLGG